jgi:Ribbon-helix-helix protein, copG family
VSIIRGEAAMKTQRDDKILVHVAPALKATVEVLAEAEGRSVSDYVRRLLLDHAADRFTEPAAEAA